MIEIASVVVKPSGDGLKIYIKVIVESPHPIRSYGPFSGVCNKDMAPLHGTHFTGTFTPVEVVQTPSFLV